MRVYATELICSTGGLGLHTFKLALCIYNKLRSHAEILSWWAFDVTFPGSSPLRSNRSGLNVSNGGSWNPKFTLKVNSFWIKIKGQYFASQVLSRHTQNLKKKRMWYFWSQGHFKRVLKWPNGSLYHCTHAYLICFRNNVSSFCHWGSKTFCLFPASLATQGNITRNNVSATMFPSLARPLSVTKLQICLSNGLRMAQNVSKNRFF